MERPPEEADYAEWIKGQQEGIQELGLALQLGGEQLEEMVERASHRYQQYFKASTSSFHRSFSLNSSPLVSPLEQAFMWFGGMRPSLSFQLIYGLAGHQIQAELEELLQVVGDLSVDNQRPASFASISALQLGQLSELQTFTTKEEDTVERQMAEVQESATDHRLLLEHFGAGHSSSSDDIQRSHSSMDSHLRRKVALLEEICTQADLLRLSTFCRVLDLLDDPHQKAQFLLAMAKLQVALRHIGHSKEGPTAR